jgi:hypothetical protein
MPPITAIKTPQIGILSASTSIVFMTVFLMKVYARCIHPQSEANGIR